MPSPTLTETHTAKSWLLMQQTSQCQPHDSSLMDRHRLTNRRQSKPADPDVRLDARLEARHEGRFARSTASSRSRLPTDEPHENKEDTGMSRDGIFEAFAEAEKSLGQTQWDTKTRPLLTGNKLPSAQDTLVTQRRNTLASSIETTRPTKKSTDSTERQTKITSTMAAIATATSTVATPLTYRRKSTAPTDSPIQSPRVRALTTKKSSDTLLGKPSLTKMGTTRRRSTAASVAGTEHGRTGATTDSAKVKRAQESDQEKEKSPGEESTLQQQQQQQQQRSTLELKESLHGGMSPRQRPTLTRATHERGQESSLADVLKDTLAAKRRIAKQEAGLSIEHLSSQRRKSKVASPLHTEEEKKPAVRQDAFQTPAEKISHAKRRMSLGSKKKEITHAMEGRRRTLSTTTAPVLDTRQKSLASRATPNPLKQTLVDQRRRSAHPIQKNTGETTTEEDRDTAYDAPYVSHSRAKSVNESKTAKHSTHPSLSSGAAVAGSTDTASTAASQQAPLYSSLAYGGSRKSSFLGEEGDVPVRRMPRTESLKEGIPTDPSITAALLVREKSIALGHHHELLAQRRMSRGKTPNVTATAEEPTPPTRTVRKRGKTLPGNMGQPPIPLPVVQLPPMKIEPIKITMPKLRDKKRSPMIRAMATTPRSRKSSLSRMTQQEEACLSSASSEEEAVRARRSKGQSSLELSSERRGSLKAMRATPGSPKTQPLSTRRQSTATSYPMSVSQASHRKSSLSLQRSLGSEDAGIKSDGYSPSLGPTLCGTRTRKSSVGSSIRSNSIYTTSRKNSTVEETVVEKGNTVEWRWQRKKKKGEREGEGRVYVWMTYA
ncbi:hypothetical protein BDF14DRAFT_472672 [Spinellus fusiger]|nr:hypothetical protein BDF14DRAFT_472672 [Spinellus fusiger]